MHTRTIGLGCLAISLLAWLAIGAVMVIDVTRPGPAFTPTLAPSVPVIALLPSDLPGGTPDTSNLTATDTITTVPTSTEVETSSATLPPTITALVVLTIDTSAPDTPTLIPPSATLAPSIPPPTLSLTSASSAAPTDSANASAAAPLSLSGTIQATDTGTGTACTPPAGWIPYSVTSGDTLFGFVLGSGNKLSVEQIMQANCLSGKLLTLGQVIYLPPGVAVNSPKIDDGPPGGTLLPPGLSRTANCPCTITIHSGWRLEQIASQIDNVPVGFTGRDFLAVTAPGAPTDGFGFLSGKPTSASLEGFMYPGDYTLSNSTTAVQFRDQMLHAFDAAIPQQWRNDAAAHGGNFYQAIVFASIVQRESSAADDQAKVASVMYNRIAANKGIAATPTVQYIFGHPGAWWPNVGAVELQSRSRYNTYIWLGLPPAPIDSPDASAIRASIYPAQTSYQYFAANCTGPGNMYASTWDQFDAMLKSCP